MKNLKIIKKYNILIKNIFILYNNIKKFIAIIK